MAELSVLLTDALPTLRKAVLSQPTDKAADEKITLRPLLMKGKTVYQAERFRGGKAYHDNLSAESVFSLARSIDGAYRQLLLVTETQSSQYCLRKDGGYKKTGSSASVPMPGGAAAHDREKEYIFSEGEDIPAFVDLGVFTKERKVVRAKYDKFRQINRFIELIDQAFRASSQTSIRILDFGCGKSYLTFLLYYYFSVRRGMDTRILGYDLKADVVEHCNELAKKYGYTGLRFEVADVTRDKLADEEIDMIVTLHACDVATDYALNYALSRRVKHIFSVPCCQKELNASIRPGGELDLLLSHGIVRERVCALLTDTIRAAVLESEGYRVDMIEFVDLDASPKNLMLRAEYTGRPKHTGLDKALALQKQYGFSQTLLTLRGNAE